MTPFNPNAKCPKCGGGEASKLWRAAVPARAAIDLKYVGLWEPARPEVPEHILRTCLTCGYSWPEAPMDAKEAAE